MFDFQRSPFIVIWEVTRACALSCVHCRAEAIARRHREELTQEEGIALLDEVSTFGDPLPLLVFTGGDPLRRPDVYNLVRYGAQKGFRVSLTPSGTAAAKKHKIEALKEAGLARLAVSLDGSTPAVHDAFRRVKGSYNWTLRICDYARECNLPIQINSTITRHNLGELEPLSKLVEKLGVALWSIFFLVPVGRGKVEDEVTPLEYERVLNSLYELSRQAPFGIKTTEAPHFRRVVIERPQGIRRDGRPVVPMPLGPVGTLPRRSIPWAGGGEVEISADGIGRAPRGVNDGNGFVFIDHLGEVYPSGFLPLSAGNVKRESLVRLYRDHFLFRDLRDPEKLKGKCGRCEYKILCGGSRSRAYALTGDYLESDPYCIYIPGGNRQPSVLVS